MSALRKIELTTTETRETAKLAVVAATPATPKTESRAKLIALFLAAPFIGLAYAVMLPFVGMGLLLKVAYEALAARYGKTTGWKAVHMVAAVIAAPFVGLVWIVALPFVGLGTLAWVGAKAATK